MKKHYKKIIITFIILIVAIVGLIVCLLPFAPKEYKLVNKYIKAVDKADAEKMMSYVAMGEAVLDEYDEDDDEYGVLELSNLNVVDYLPDDAEIEGLKLIGCSISEQESETFGIEIVTVEAVVEMEYKDAAGKKQTVTSIETFMIGEYDGQTKIISIE